MPPRFAARPAHLVIGELADALGWPRTRPARLLAGDRATTTASLVLCADEAALAGLDGGPDVAAVLATPPISGDGRLGRRAYDPFAGSADDPTSWRRAERVVLDASLLLAGGAGGIDEHLAALVGLAPDGPARSVPRDTVKFVGYVPTDSLDAVRDATFAAGAGSIGDYDRCSWSTTGTGTFRGGDGTDPAVGTRGEFEQVEETRFETVVPRHLVDSVCRAYVAAHPYEEPAFDVLDMAIPAPVGFGRTGRLGAGGGAHVWSGLSALDPELVAHGRVDAVPAAAAAIVTCGPLRDLLGAVLATEGLGLVVCGAATDAELALLEERGTAVLVLDRRRAFAAHAAALAGRLTRRLELPVTAAGVLAFPTDEPGPAPDHAAPGDDPAANVFAGSSSPAAADFATGTWRLHFDGGSRGNPGPAAYGWVLYAPSGDEFEADGVKIGSTTNNVAEWTGLLRGLEHAADRGVRTLQVRGDSELVVKQVTGVYKVKNAALKPLAEQVAKVLRRFDSVDVAHVYRADNARADAVANEALDGLR